MQFQDLLYFKGTESELETLKTECHHSTLETGSEKEVIPVLPTKPASSEDGAIAEMENVNFNDDIIEEKERTQIAQITLETASEEEGKLLLLIAYVRTNSQI